MRAIRRSPSPTALTCIVAVVCVLPTVSHAQGLASAPAPQPPAPVVQGAPSGESSAQSVEDLLGEGSRLFERKEHTAARARFELALTRARERGDVRAEAEAHRGLGAILYASAQYAGARSEQERALLLFTEVGDDRGIARAYNALGSIAWAMGEYGRARDLYTRARLQYEAIGDLRGTAIALLNLKLVPGTNPDDSAQLTEKGLAIARRIGDKSLEGSFLHSWGDEYFSRGDFLAATEKLQEAAALFEQVGGRQELARVFTSLGRVHRAHGAYDQAAEYYRRALTIQEEVGDQQGLIQTLNALSIAYSWLDRREEAVELLQRALTLARETGSPRIVSSIVRALATMYTLSGELSHSVDLLEELVRQDLSDYDAAFCYGALSEASYGLKRYDRAFEAADKAVELARRGANAEYFNRPLLLRARARHKLGQSAEALADTREALREIEQLRARLVPTDFMKQGFGDLHRDAFDLAIQLQHEAGQYEEALKTGEQARSRAFLDLLATREIEPGIAVRGDPAPRRQDSESELKSLVSAAPPSLAELTGVASRLRSTLLDYWVGPEATVIWTVAPNGRVTGARVDVSAEELTRLVQQTWGAAQVPPSLPPGNERPARMAPRSRGGDLLVMDDDSKQAWRALYRLLIDPVRRSLPTAPGSLLTIVPHGPLLRLSFAALIDDRGRYLIETYAVHYAPSAAVLQFTAKRRTSTPSGDPRYLLVANPRGVPALPDGKRLPPLPGTEREVARVARTLPANRVTILTGTEALESRVRALAGETTVIHLATHGVVRDDEPLDSFVALGVSGEEEAADGRLTAQEVYGLDLTADLVVLSACRTALGKVSGDGIAGLTRAFLYAGTPSVVATLWDVADEPSYLLVPQFYRSWKSLHDKSRALRFAQLQLLGALRAGQVTLSTPDGPAQLPEHPIFWAGYILVGEP